MLTDLLASPFIMYLWLALGLLLSARLVLARHWREQPRRAQRVGGVLTGGLGVLFPIISLFLPMWTVTEVRTEETVTRTESMWQRGVEPEVTVMLAILVGMAIGFGIAANLDSRYPNRLTLYSMWGCTGFLLVVSAITGFSVGWILFPVALLALATTIQATRRHQKSFSTSALEQSSTY